MDGRLTIGMPAPLFEASAVAFNTFFDVSADGQRFLMPIRPELPPRPIHVVSGWKRA